RTNIWVRYIGIGGDTVIPQCAPVYYGGVYYPIYVTFTHPQSESETPTTGYACGNTGLCCNYYVAIEVIYCSSGGFYVYKQVNNHPINYMGYVTYHRNCVAGSCGPLAECSTTKNGGCECVSGYKIPPTHIPTNESYGCQDINECAETANLCGPHSNCTNLPGAYNCSCLEGFAPSDPALALNPSRNPCTDVNECVEIEKVCGGFGTCTNTPGNYTCTCYKGYKPDGPFDCQDIDECFNSTICGQESVCTNTPGAHNCTCLLGFSPTNPVLDPSNANPCRVSDKQPLHSPVGSISAQQASTGQVWSGAGKDGGESGSVVLKISELLVNALVDPSQGQVNKSIQTPELGVEYGNGTEGKMRHWSVDGCWVVFSDENYTVCSCSHLSTFALIMQTGEVQAQPCGCTVSEDNPFLEWVNRMCVIVGLVFFALAILTFLLCSWNPKINNTARLHLCLCLFLSHLLLLLDYTYLTHKLVCSIMAGLLHFLVVASFLWMLLEALQLYLLVQRLSRIQVIQRDGLQKKYLYLIGYGIPLVIVGVSAAVKQDGYGGTKVLIIFKILAQFVILGCTWVLGFFQSTMVRDEYRKWLGCSSSSSTPDSMKGAPSVSEDLDKAGKERQNKGTRPG
ncbi:unnamed protein product, partial [Coregonus sp. 'balchen']